MSQKPQLGFGLGLRPEHYVEILDHKPQVDWFEILTENYLVPGGKPLYYLEQVCERYPIVMHGVSMSLGGTDPFDLEYLKAIKKLAKQTNALWVSDHLCWTGTENINMHDLLPMPYTEEAINHLTHRIKEVQDILEQRILIENVSSYLEYHISSMTEWEFLAELLKQADCHLLLDVNNVYVSSINHQFDPKEYIRALPSERIYQIHLAGHSNFEDYILDTHDQPIIDPVWELYADTLAIHGSCSTMIERDDHIPPLSELLAELNKARQIASSVEAEVLA